MAPHESDLCTVCRTINFDSLLTAKRSKALKSWSQIKETSASCAFCHFIVAAYSTADPADDGLPDAGDEPVRLSSEDIVAALVTASDADGISRQNDFSNKSDLKRLAKLRPPQHNFRIVLHRGPRQIRTHLLPARHARATDGPTFSARALDRDRARTGLLRSWVSRCASHHGISCSRPGAAATGLQAGLRVVDLARRAVVPAPRGCAYAALSYVWGPDEVVRALHRTERRDAVPADGGGEAVHYALPARLPRTVEDAATLARRLGFAYLWVDALCIVQDDAADKARQLGGMGAVYARAGLTIVAGSSPHADFGIHGVGVPRAVGQTRGRVAGRVFAAMLPSFAEADAPGALPWNDRAWTLQEKLLSPRRLCLTSAQAHFACRNARWREDVRAEPAGAPPRRARARDTYAWAPDRPGHETDFRNRLNRRLDAASFGVLHAGEHFATLGRLPVYCALVEALTARAIRHQADVLPASAAALASLGLGDVHFGLPECHLALALLWQPGVGECTDAHVDVPSWSWARWRVSGGCVYDVEALRSTKSRLRRTDFVDLAAVYRPALGGEAWARLEHDVRDSCGELRLLGAVPSTVRSPCSGTGADSERQPSPTFEKSFLAFATHVLRLHIGAVLPEPVASRHALGSRPPPEMAWHALDDARGRRVGRLLASLAAVRAREERVCEFVTLSWNQGASTTGINRGYIPVPPNAWGRAGVREEEGWRLSVLEEDRRPLVRRYGRPSRERDQDSGVLGSMWKRGIDGAVSGLWGKRTEGSGRVEQDGWPFANVMLVEWDRECSDGVVKVGRRVALGDVMVTGWIHADRRKEEIVLV